jgi:hypothetical protein
MGREIALARLRLRLSDAVVGPKYVGTGACITPSPRDSYA